MAKPTATDKRQTAVPKKNLGKAFSKRRGAIQVGAGSTVTDVREARSQRGGPDAGELL